MIIKHRLTDFPVSAFINQRTDTEDITIGQVYCWDEVEHCILQALADNDDSYYLHIGDLDITLTDEDIFDKVDKLYPQCTTYPLYSFNIMHKLRERNKGNIPDMQGCAGIMDKYEKYYGAIGYTD